MTLDGAGDGEGHRFAEADDVARLNYDFNLRERCPDFQFHFDAWAEMAASFRDEWAELSRLDISYGPTPLETFDLFLPGTPNPPVCIFFHPGSWQRLDKSLFSFIARPFTERGCAAIFVNYPLVPTVRMGDIVDSVERCVRWIMGHAVELGVDGERLALFGHSAGGHLVTALYARPWLFSAAESRRIRGVACIGGFYDLDAVRRSFMNDALALTPADVEHLSPIASRDFMNCELVLAVGENETEEFHVQQDRMVAHLAACGRSVESLRLTGHDHFSLVRDLALASNPMISRIVAMFAK